MAQGEALWTDPQDFPGRGPSKRGVGVGFGPDVTASFVNPCVFSVH